MLSVKFISMNYENVYGYLCFCCADAVDCGAGTVSCMREVGVDRYGLGRCWGIVFTLAPVSGTGTGFGPLPLRERGILAVVLACSPASPPTLWILP